MSSGLPIHTILPSRTMNAQGIPSCPAAFIHFSLVDFSLLSMATGYAIAVPLRSTNGRTVVMGSSEIPMIVRPFALYFEASSLRCGIDRMHGPHQVAQNSTTIVALGSLKFGASPCTISTVRSGALDPTLRSPAKALMEKEQRANAAAAVMLVRRVIMVSFYRPTIR